MKTFSLKSPKLRRLPPKQPPFLYLVRQYDAHNLYGIEAILDQGQGSVKFSAIYVVLRISSSTSRINNLFRIFGNNGADDQLINILSYSHNELMREESWLLAMRRSL